MSAYTYLATDANRNDDIGLQVMLSDEFSGLRTDEQITPFSCRTAGLARPDSSSTVHHMFPLLPIIVTAALDGSLMSFVLFLHVPCSLLQLPRSHLAKILTFVHFVSPPIFAAYRLYASIKLLITIIVVRLIFNSSLSTNRRCLQPVSTGNYPGSSIAETKR